MSIAWSKKATAGAILAVVLLAGPTEAQEPPASSGSGPRALTPDGARVPQKAPAKKANSLNTKATAAAIADRWSNSPRNIPAPGADGRVVYTFGAGQPYVVCQVGALCVIELETGEWLRDVPKISDTANWRVDLAIAGTDASPVTNVIIKPSLEQSSADLFLATDRRTYFLKLETSSGAHNTPRIAFSYPDSEQKAWQDYNQRQVKRAEPVVDTMPSVSAEDLDYDYRWDVKNQGKRFEPARVFADRRNGKLYIQMQPDIRHLELPAVFAEGDGGELQLLDGARFKKGFFIIDYLPRRVVLLGGVGDGQDVVTIRHGGCDRRDFFGRCVD